MRRAMCLLDITRLLTLKLRFKTISITNSLSTTTDGESQQEPGSLRLRRLIMRRLSKTDLPPLITITIVEPSIKWSGVKIRNSPMSLTVRATLSYVKSLLREFSESKELLLIPVTNSSPSSRLLLWILIQHSTSLRAKLFMKTLELLSGPASGKPLSCAPSASSLVSISSKCTVPVVLLL